jgi:hypothetical protein
MTSGGGYACHRVLRVRSQRQWIVGRRTRREVRVLSDGRIPSGILVASMTGVRLSFRGELGDARSVHFARYKVIPTQPKLQFWVVFGRVKEWCPTSLDTAF